ncbi:MAG: hypothetical protein HOC79_08160 [Euryarchaeota archaeon]|nr:hypothetical protein [Euryarchaeota archaeon]
MRTSISHPLYINWLPTEGDEGKIGMTLCPGKYQPRSWTGSWDRDLDLDLATLRDAGVDRLISLVTNEDMEVLRVLDLPHKVEEYGLEWNHLPIADTTVPDKVWLSEAEPVFAHLLKSIPKGECVVVHCMGGLSRAGVFAAMFFWLRGMAMRDAIAHIRANRSLRCINQRQEEFLLNHENVTPISPIQELENDKKKESLQFARKISSMIINNISYTEISKELEDAIGSNQSLDWEVIGDHICAIIQVVKNQFFTKYNLLDFSMQAYEADGEDSIFKRFQCQFALAKIYSDQSGLKRKIELYEDLVEESTSRMKEKSTEDPFYYWLTRSLNRLAQLTQEWMGKETAEPLWHQLANVCTEAKEDEGLKIIMQFAPWFVATHPEFFSHHTD